MDNDNPKEDSKPQVDWVSYHESQSQDIDVNSVVALVRRVGGELASIDDKKVDGSFRPALQIDKAKLINDLQKNKPAVSTQQPPVQPSAESYNSTRQSPPVLKSSHSQTNTKSILCNNTDVSAIEARLSKLESATKAFKSAKRIKKGVTYSVSSNSMKGQIKDASLLAEFVLSELAKGVKTITIKLHENTNSESG